MSKRLDDAWDAAEIAYLAYGVADSDHADAKAAYEAARTAYEAALQYATKLDEEENTVNKKLNEALDAAAAAEAAYVAYRVTDSAYDAACAVVFAYRVDDPYSAQSADAKAALCVAFDVKLAAYKVYEAAKEDVAKLWVVSYP